MENKFLFDTYALIEISKGNPNYERYVDKGIIINNFIFAEYCYYLVKKSVPNKNQKATILENSIIHANPEILKKAMRFRYKNRKKKLSMADCISYIMSLKLGIKFLTGDKEFKDMENVEFVK